MQINEVFYTIIKPTRGCDYKLGPFASYDIAYDAAIDIACSSLPEYECVLQFKIERAYNNVAATPYEEYYT